MATVTEVRALTLAQQRNQSRRAAAIAALVALYYRHRVKVEDPASIERWIDLMLPKLIAEHDSQALRAARYGNTLRKLELPGPQAYTFEPTVTLTPEQVIRSLNFVGPTRHLKKVREIREADLDPTMERALLEDAADKAAASVGGSVARHVQNGARQTLYDNVQRDPVALGYIRITKTDPCYFCAALASRGPIYGEDSFDASDPRFTGSGTAKVHDSCGCTLKPMFKDDDEFVVDAANFEALWFQWAKGSDPMYEFRRNYEGRADGPRRPRRRRR